MPIEVINFENQSYPHYQTTGFASQYAFPYAKQVCTGTGFDIGCGKKEWALPGSIPIDRNFDDGFDALHLPDFMVDFIFSSHCAEHIPNWVEVLDYWTSRIKSGGVLFLYLPDYSQRYWRPWNNRKHVNILTPRFLFDYMEQAGYHSKKIFVSGVDLYNSFMVMGEKI